MILKAASYHLEEILTLTQACAQAMIKLGIYQWNDKYPGKKRLEQDIKAEELYMYYEQKKIKGIIVLTEKMDDEYYPVSWLTPNQNNLYIHRLAVHPASWGIGIGQRLMSFAEEFASKQEFKSVRLDTFSQNQRNISFYEQRGYQRLEEIYFPKQSKFPFYCYELPLVAQRQDAKSNNT
ncbi:GNAT family N-acetyltransferase [Aquimarina brevivitae]|uniref:Acetyltransferase (GNAT) family protein n=1 Tax=Aquimarina brevivitae TaxID=323412 RepID=A0A4Q7PG82_9FLAO|nr:GNAT family N-acetyltransferase [Aquimarina brevivitae]RZS99523.1 acetyltransferase (GNAT) family protein [Aquimarina brevivitae]